MKKIILLLVLSVFISLNSMADGYTATLQHGDNVTAYYGVDAFKSAYAAAADSDVITLSAGTFNTVDSIGKSITVRGNYAMDDGNATTFLPSLKISANNVWLDGVYVIGNLCLGTIKDCKITHSWIESILTATGTHINTVVDQCVVKDERANTLGQNYTLSNCTIYCFGTTNTVNNIAYISNCVVYGWFSYDTTYNQPFAIYKNNLIGYYDRNLTSYRLSLKKPNEFYNNIFFSEGNHADYNVPAISTGCIFSNNIYKIWNNIFSSNISTYPSRFLQGFNTKGQDSTLCGPNGGHGFSYYPSVPYVSSATIDPNTDSTGKLNVKIAVSVHK